MMFETFVRCADGLEQVLNEFAKNKEPLDVKEVAARYTTDIIGSAAFGIDCNSLKDPNAEFRRVGQKIFAYDPVVDFKRKFAAIMPASVVRAFRIKITNKEVEKFLSQVIRETIEYREKNNVSRKDFIHLLLQLKNKGRVTDDDSFTPDDKKAGSGTFLTLNEILAHSFVFFAAGFETSSTTMTFAMYELALNQDIQDKVRKEVNTVLQRHDNKFTYDAINEMVYLEKVFNGECSKLCKKNPSIFLINFRNASEIPAVARHAESLHQRLQSSRH